MKLYGATGKNVRRLVCGRKHFCILTNGIDASLSTIEGVRDCKAGERLKLKLFAKDVHENAMANGGYKFSAFVILEDGSLIIIDVDDNLDGSYDCVPRILKSGLTELHISYGGIHISGSPFHFEVYPGDVYQ